MPTQVVFALKSMVAARTRKRFLALVGLEVNFDIASLRTHLVAPVDKTPVVPLDLPVAVLIEALPPR